MKWLEIVLRVWVTLAVSGSLRRAQGKLFDYALRAPLRMTTLLGVLFISALDESAVCFTMMTILYGWDRIWFANGACLCVLL